MAYQWHNTHDTLDAMLDELVGWWLTADGANDSDYVSEMLADSDGALADHLIEEAELDVPTDRRPGPLPVSHMDDYGYGRPQIMDAIRRFRRDRPDLIEGED